MINLSISTTCEKGFGQEFGEPTQHLVAASAVFLAYRYLIRNQSQNRPRQSVEIYDNLVIEHWECRGEVPPTLRLVGAEAPFPVDPLKC